MLTIGSANSDWYLGLTIGFVIVTVVVIVVAMILTYASRIADQTRLANEGLEDVRDRTAPLWEVRKTNAAGVAILGAARTARDVVVAHVTGNGAAGAAPPAPSFDDTGPPPSFVPPLEPRRTAAATPSQPPGVLGPEGYPNRGRGA